MTHMQSCRSTTNLINITTTIIITTTTTRLVHVYIRHISFHFLLNLYLNLSYVMATQSY